MPVSVRRKYVCTTEKERLYNNMREELALMCTVHVCMCVREGECEFVCVSACVCVHVCVCV